MCSVCKEPIKGKFFKDKETGKFLCISDYQVLNPRTYLGLSVLIPIYKPELKNASNANFQYWRDSPLSRKINSTLSVLGFVSRIININFDYCLIKM